MFSLATGRLSIFCRSQAVKSASIGCVQRPSIWPAVQTPARRRAWPNSSRRRVISDDWTTRSASCGGIKITAPVTPQDNIARHHRRSANPDGYIDPDHRGVEADAGGGVANMVRRVVVADKRSEVFQLVEAVDIAHRAIVDDAVSTLGVNRAANVIAHRGPVLLKAEVIRHIHVAGLQHVHRPRIGASDAAVGFALGFDDAQDIGTPGEPLRGEPGASRPATVLRSWSAEFA